MLNYPNHKKKKKKISKGVGNTRDGKMPYPIPFRPDLFYPILSHACFSCPKIGESRNAFI